MKPLFLEALPWDLPPARALRAALSLCGAAQSVTIRPLPCRRDEDIEIAYFPQLDDVAAVDFPEEILSL